MNVYTYAQASKLFDDKVVALWAANWSLQGFEPVFLDEKDAMGHPLFNDWTTDDWMMHSISKNQRKKLRRHRRRLDQDYPGNWFVKFLAVLISVPGASSFAHE